MASAAGMHDDDQSTPPSTGGVRRHHTITATSRTARAPVVSEEDQQQQHQLWDDDEVVDQTWVGGVGAVGEKTSLHRQASLPTKYNRAFHGSKTGTNTPKKTLNSLSAIAGHEGDEEDWEKDISSYRNEDQHPISVSEHPQHQQVLEQGAGQSPLSPHFGGQPPIVPSPPPAESGIRRHQSLTYGASGHGTRHLSSAGLKRSGTLQASTKHAIAPQPPSPTNAEEDYPDEGEYDDDASYYATSPRSQQPQNQVQYSNSPIGRASPWGQNNEWRGNNGQGTASGVNIDDVQLALSSLDISGNPPQGYQPGGSGFQPGQAVHPPRFNPDQLRNLAGNDGNNNANLQHATDLDERQNSQGTYSQQSQHHRSRTHGEREERPWDQRERSLGGRSSNPNMAYGYQQGQQNKTGVPSVPPLPPQFLQQQQNVQAPRLGQSTSGNGQGGQNQAQGQNNNFPAAPIDVPSLIAAKGYNPSNFEIKPQFARFFVIKSYTEDDVHKSLKYEIWSSTDPGNKRLDKAFKETAGRGPIYLFFSVNASGHFCGMAEMLTPVDYTRSSTVWASDKWKGVFKVRWIFVRDIPNANLRHIKLNNTQERKPVTNSRDTQELLPDAGHEMLRIFHSHPARTSLLQDFAFYELQSLQKMQVPQGPATGRPAVHSPPPQSTSPIMNASQQPPFGMLNPNALAYTMPQMTPLMQMQLQMNMNAMGNQYGGSSTRAMHQSVMRHPSPGPANDQGNYTAFQ